MIVVVEENRDMASIIGNSQAPFLNELARTGLNLTDMHAETHPSQPNYLALFSGSTRRLTGDSCPHTYRGDNLADQVLAQGLRFVGYAESMPHSGFAGCSSYPYARKHAPWVNFTDLPPTISQPMTAFPSDLAELPDLGLVIPNLRDDMHDGTIAQGDAWLNHHLGGYARWAGTHHSLLLVTWDESEGDAANRIATIAVGAGIEAATWSRRADHYTLLATLEAAFGLPRLGFAAQRGDIPPLD